MIELKTLFKIQQILFRICNFKLQYNSTFVLFIEFVLTFKPTQIVILSVLQLLSSNCACCSRQFDKNYNY